jgi:hypothetical protein
MVLYLKVICIIIWAEKINIVLRLCVNLALNLISDTQKYIWDTNALIKMSNDYDFESSWIKFKEYCERGQFIIHQEVRNELNARLIEDDEDDKYVKFLSDFNCFIDNESSYIQEYQDIVKSIAIEYGYQDLFDQEKDKNWADPWLIALAKHINAILITEESQKPEKRKIPAIAKKLDVKVLRTVDFLKSQNWF